MQTLQLILLHSSVARVTNWTVARQASQVMGFPKQEYWSDHNFSSIPDPGIEPASPAYHGTTWEDLLGEVSE